MTSFWNYTLFSYAKKQVESSVKGYVGFWRWLLKGICSVKLDMHFFLDTF